MMDPTAPQPRGVHLVGSLPKEAFSTATAVFSQVPQILPGRLRRIPDGEPGDRYYYIMWQESVFPTEILKRTAAGNGGTLPNPPHTLQLEDIKPTGYDDAAIASYAAFTQARIAGHIPKGVRFQVSLPAPIEAITFYVHDNYQKAAEALYEQRMLQALSRIQEEIPPEDLAIQWDLAATVILIETERGRLNSPYFSCWFDNTSEYISDLLRRFTSVIKPEVETGFHLCYGDYEHKHFVEPKDMGVLVELANRLIREIQPVHSISWIHMPVPKDRKDEAYFAPLRTLELPRETELFLGVVHSNDVEGTRERIEAARKVFGNFGVATECGMGRTPTDDGLSNLEIAAQVSSPY